MACQMNAPQMPMGQCNVTWVPVMMVPAGMMSGQATPMLMSGQCTPNPMMAQQMQMCGQLPSGCMTPVMMPQMPQKYAPVEVSNLSTAVPSGAGSDAGSDVDESEDISEACAELIQQLEAGGEAREAAIEAISGSVVELSFDAAACRVVQKAFELADVEVAAELANELQGHVREALRCPHANHVVQKLLDTLPADRTVFVVHELLGAAVEFAKHRFGCRVVSRAVKVHASAFSCNEAMLLVDELLSEAEELCRHASAHYAVEAILEAGSTQHTHEVACALRMDLLRNAKHRSATHVVEKALVCCDSHDQDAMASELFGSAEALLQLTENQFGCHLAKALPRLEGHFRQAQKYLPAARPLLEKTKYGRRVLQEYSQHMQ